MKKLLFLFLLCAVVARADEEPTPTATATATNTATPTATATTTSTPTATATSTPSATATGTPVPTPTPMAVLYVQDVDGQKRALIVNANVNESGDILMKPNANIGFANVIGPFYGIGRSDDPADADKFYLEPVKGGLFPNFRRNDQAWDVGFDFSLITATRNPKFPDKDGTIAMLSDVAAVTLNATTNTIPKQASSSSLVDSVITDDGTDVMIGVPNAAFIDLFYGGDGPNVIKMSASNIALPGLLYIDPVGGGTVSAIACDNASTGSGAVVLATGPTLSSLTISGKLTSYNGVTTSGWGMPAIQKAARSTGQTAANTSVATYTCGAADGSFEVSANVLVTTATVHSFTATVSYTDEGNTSRVVTMQFSTLAGAFVTAMTNAQGTVPYEGVPLHIRVKASTAITVATTGTFTSVAYNVEAVIRQLQ